MHELLNSKDKISNYYCINFVSCEKHSKSCGKWSRCSQFYIMPCSLTHLIATLLMCLLYIMLFLNSSWFKYHRRSFDSAQWHIHGRAQLFDSGGMDCRTSWGEADQGSKPVLFSNIALLTTWKESLCSRNVVTFHIHDKESRWDLQ